MSLNLEAGIKADIEFYRKALENYWTRPNATEAEFNKMTNGLADLEKELEELLMGNEELWECPYCGEETSPDNFGHEGFHEDQCNQCEPRRRNSRISVSRSAWTEGELRRNFGLTDKDLKK